MNSATNPSRAVAPLGGSVRAAVRNILDTLFPIACVGCGNYGEGNSPKSPVGLGPLRGEQGAVNRDDADQWLCQSCRERIEEDVPRCLVCTEHSPTGRTCYGCLPKTPITGTIAVGWYHDPILRAAITALKFGAVRGGIPALADPLGELLARRIAAAGLHRPLTTKSNDQIHGERVTGLQGPPELASTLRGKGGSMGGGKPQVFPPQLVPLPLHPRRERERGFNQARRLAEVIGTHLDLPMHDVLVRTRPTAPQTSLRGSTDVRRRNVARAFALYEFPTPNTRLPSRIILVDDVLTSGATLEAAAAVLAGAGVKEIWAAVVARG